MTLAIGLAILVVLTVVLAVLAALAVANLLISEGVEGVADEEEEAVAEEKMVEIVVIAHRLKTLFH